jgi:hypothetical protein
VKSIDELIEEGCREGATLRELEMAALRRKAERERLAAVAAARLDIALRFGLRAAALIVGAGAVLWVLDTIQFHP